MRTPEGRDAQHDPARHCPSYYAASALAQPERPALAGAQRADVCVVGAGYTGLSAALHLQDAGYRVVVLEQALVGWGASGRNGGQIVNSYSRDLDVIEARHGAAQAAAMGRMAFEGGRIIRELVARHGIDCQLKDGGLFAALNARQLRGLEAHQRLWERHGLQGLRLLDREAVRREVASERYLGALLDPSGGHVHPLRLAQGEALAFERGGGRIHEQSAATRIERGARLRVHTAQGCVEAEQVLLAGNAYLGRLEPALAARSMPCGTQVLATEPLGARAAALLPQDRCVEDCNYLLDYFRLSADGRLLFGGGVVYGARDPARVEALLRPKLERVFPQLRGVRVDYAWTGNFLLTLSRLPQVGRLAPNILYSQGCSGHGLTYSHLAGRLLAECVRGQSERFDVFARLPHLPFPGGRRWRAPLSALGAAWYALRDRLG